MPHHLILNIVAVVIVSTIGCIALFRYSKSNDPEDEEENKKRGVITYIDDRGRIFRDNKMRPHKKAK